MWKVIIIFVFIHSVMLAQFTHKFEKIAQINDPGLSWGLTIEKDSTVFLANGTEGLWVYKFYGDSFQNITLINNGVDNYGDATNVAIGMDGTIFLANYGDGLRAYRYQDNLLINVAHIDDGGRAWDVCVGRDSTIFLANDGDGLRAYEFISDSLVNTAFIDLGNDGAGILAVAARSDSIVFVGNSISGIHAYKYTGSEFIHIASINDGGDARDLVLTEDNILYLANGQDGLRAYSFDNNIFTNIGHIYSGGFAEGVAVSADGTIFLANRDDGLRAYQFNGNTFTNTAKMLEYKSIFSVATLDEETVFLSDIDSGLFAFKYTEDNDNLIYVPDDYSTIQEAIDVSSDSDTIIVRDGIYNENIQIDNKSILIASEYLLDADTAHISNTIISGNAQDKVISLNNSNLVLAGVTIKDGHSSNYGGGIYSGWDNSTVIVENCKFQNNQAINEGGAIWVWGENSNLKINNCTFENNSSKSGGAIFSNMSDSTIIQNSYFNNNSIVGSGGAIFTTGTNLILENSTVLNNFSDTTSSDGNSQGGGIYVWESPFEIKNTIFKNNHARDYGGGATIRHSSGVIDSTTFEGNYLIGVGSESWYSKGGGLSIHNHDSLLTNSVTIENTIFKNNKSINSGGGLYAISDYESMAALELTLKYCVFNSNHSDHIAGYDISGKDTRFLIQNSHFVNNYCERYSAGGNFSNACKGNVENSLFENNIASLQEGGNYNSGGVSIWSGADVEFEKCTFVKNLASYGAGLTVGMGAHASINNSIFWGNSNDQIGLVNYDNIIPTLDIDFSCIQNGIDSVFFSDSTEILNWGSHNLTSNPLFCNYDEGVFTLAENSPCVGAGENGEDIGAFGIGCGVVGVREEAEIPNEFKLMQNYPNPFNPGTTISYSLPKSGMVHLKVYDLLGREVANIVNKEQSIGNYKVEFNAQNLATGVYLYRLQSGGFTETKKLILLR